MSFLVIDFFMNGVFFCLCINLFFKLWRQRSDVWSGGQREYTLREKKHESYLLKITRIWVILTTLMVMFHQFLMDVKLYFFPEKYILQHKRHIQESQQNHSKCTHFNWYFAEASSSYPRVGIDLGWELTQSGK